jgi:hypothetical protein
MAFYNKISGEVIEFDGDYKSYFRRRSAHRHAWGFINYVKENVERPFYKHITLTLAKPLANHSNVLNGFFNKMRRDFGKIVYVWTSEIQEERLEKYGDAVLHWHVMVCFTEYVLFDGEKIKKIVAYWPYGIVQVRPAPLERLNYLIKYIDKAVGEGINGKVRHSGSSRVHPMYKVHPRDFAIMKKSQFAVGLSIMELEQKGVWRNGDCYDEIVDDEGFDWSVRAIYKRPRRFGWIR